MAINKAMVFERVAFVTAVVLVAATLVYHSTHAQPTAAPAGFSGDSHRAPSSDSAAVEKSKPSGGMGI